MFVCESTKMITGRCHHDCLARVPPLATDGCDAIRVAGCTCSSVGANCDESERGQALVQVDGAVLHVLRRNGGAHSALELPRAFAAGSAWCRSLFKRGAVRRDRGPGKLLHELVVPCPLVHQATTITRDRRCLGVAGWPLDNTPSDCEGEEFARLLKVMIWISRFAQAARLPAPRVLHRVCHQ